ncbi:unnamed protein product [Nyctereutes procyonoides]|uniref:(raccoon dog) hypothetical protein n=1 Tax=Nyctereutes procyonoides TaxID=34880 RepID=A0A811ZZH7_NYCPR|nr:unnamed protein product [Nyctereutes procyonoides]
MGSPHPEQMLPWNSFWKPRRLLSANEPGRPVSHRERRQGFPQLVINRQNRRAGPPPPARPPARRHQGALDSGPQVAPLGARWEGFQRGTVTCPGTQDSYHLQPGFCPALSRGPQPPSDPNVTVPWRVTDHRPPPHTHTQRLALPFLLPPKYGLWTQAPGARPQGGILGLEEDTHTHTRHSLPPACPLPVEVRSLEQNLAPGVSPVSPAPPTPQRLS